ncbi:MAG: hypothetical protein GY765_32400 [bacterium]|nr:hypothetical protein [bacterium]
MNTAGLHRFEMRTVFCIVMGLLLMAGPATAKKIATLSEVMKPNYIAFDHEHIYVSEKTTVYIYSAKDYSFIKQFGRAGEGPQEFLKSARVFPRKNELVINSKGKVSIFTKDGEFIREMRTAGGKREKLFIPLDDNFAGVKRVNEKTATYSVFSLYDAQLNKIREFHKRVNTGYQNGKIDLLKAGVIYRVMNNQIYIPAADGFILDILDHTGTSVHRIERKNYKAPTFDAQAEKEYVVYLKNRWKAAYPKHVKRIMFPEVFQDIWSIFTDGAAELLYVMTWKHDRKGRREVFVYTPAGKPVKRVFVKLNYKDFRDPYPIAAWNKRFYQFVDNGEELELHAIRIK